MQEKKTYAEGIRNTGAQEVPALKKNGAVKKGTAHRGEDLRAGK